MNLPITTNLADISILISCVNCVWKSFNLR
nr:MAG TPA: hypothetical protein [Caudoviricetes sp.]